MPQVPPSGNRCQLRGSCRLRARAVSKAQHRALVSKIGFRALARFLSRLFVPTSDPTRRMSRRSLLLAFLGRATRPSFAGRREAQGGRIGFGGHRS